MRSAPDASPSGPMYTITTHRPWTTLITLNIETAEVGAWLTPARLVGQTIAIRAGKRLVR